VAKGIDKIAFRIREIAEANNVPVIEDAPLARALYATVEVDQTIPREHYEAVAKVIGFVLGAGRKRARQAR
jgi:flagellar biosynthetic protein FlhB